MTAKSMVSYEIFMLLGLWSAVNVIFWCLILIVGIPILCYWLYKRYRENTAHIRRVAAIKRSLVKKPYSKELFPQPEYCAICLNEWAPGDEVCVLPCSKTHIFCTTCIE
jgi:hypothetical protein